MRILWIKTGKFQPADNITYSTDFAIYKKYYLAGVKIPFFLNPLEIEESKVYTVVAEIDLEEWKANILCKREGGGYRNEVIGALPFVSLRDKWIIPSKFPIKIKVKEEIIPLSPLKGRFLKPLTLKVEKGKGLILFPLGKD